jgi:hypothetical protein
MHESPGESQSSSATGSDSRQNEISTTLQQRFQQDAQHGIMVTIEIAPSRRQFFAFHEWTFADLYISLINIKLLLTVFSATII